jgi:hypothetical protein
MVIASYDFKIKFMKSIATILKGAAPVLAIFTMISVEQLLQLLQLMKTFIVGPQTADCTGVAPMKCLQVKEKPTDNWSNFYRISKVYLRTGI